MHRALLHSFCTVWWYNNYNLVQMMLLHILNTILVSALCSPLLSHPIVIFYSTPFYVELFVHIMHLLNEFVVLAPKSTKMVKYHVPPGLLERYRLDFDIMLEHGFFCFSVISVCVLIALCTSYMTCNWGRNAV